MGTICQKIINLGVGTLSFLDFMYLNFISKCDKFKLKLRKGGAMTQRERQLLEIIRRNPLISQKEIAELLGINRSSVAVHIVNLMKKGYIKGKGYIIGEEAAVCVIGGSNIDLQGFPKDKLKQMDSNPGRIETSLGGVGRNIAENLARLSVPVRLLTAVGNDFYGQKIIEESSALGVHMEDILISKEYPTSMYLSIMDENSDLKVAISQMDLYELIDESFINDKHMLIKNASVIVIDTNIPKDTIDYLCGLFQGIPIFADPVSTTKAMRLKNSLGKLHTIKPNIHEASKLLNCQIRNIDDIRRAGEAFLNSGVKKVYISMGKEGVFACDEKEELLIKASVNEIKSATGAGDAFMAGLVNSHLKEASLKEAITYATGAALLALDSYGTINPLMADKAIKEILSKTEVDIKKF